MAPAPARKDSVHATSVVRRPVMRSLPNQSLLLLQNLEFAGPFRTVVARVDDDDLERIPARGDSAQIEDAIASRSRTVRRLEKLPLLWFHRPAEGPRHDALIELPQLHPRS